MRIAVLGFILLTAPSVVAQEHSRVVEGCLAALAFGSTQQSVEPVVVQDFDDLDPPRARISFNIPGVDAPRAFTGECRFRNDESPLGLTSICVEQNCHDAESDSDRFQEITLLLEQAGY